MNGLSRIVLGEPGPRDDRPGFLLSTPWDRDFVDELKGLFPRDRAWDPDEEVWWVADEHRDHVQALVIRHFGAYELVDEDGVVETVSPGARSRQERLF